MGLLTEEILRDAAERLSDYRTGYMCHAVKYSESLGIDEGRAAMIEFEGVLYRHGISTNGWLVHRGKQYHSSVGISHNCEMRMFFLLLLAEAGPEVW